MPFVERLDELAEWIADQAGIYADPRCGNAPEDDTEGMDFGHVEDCSCRQFWVSNVVARMRQALKNETMLST